MVRAGSSGMLSRCRPGAFRLRSKIALSVLLVVTVIFGTVIWFFASSSSDKAIKDAEALAVTTVKDIGNNVKMVVDSNINVLHTPAHS